MCRLLSIERGRLKIIFQTTFDITGDMRISLGYEPSYVCCRPDYDMVWNHSVTIKTACVRTAHTLHLNLKVCVACSSRVCGVATHAAGMDAGYGLLAVIKFSAAEAALTDADGNALKQEELFFMVEKD